MGKPLRGRVGRHANTGAQCQNWADDQQTVMELLNGIAVADGGPEMRLGGRVIAGIASNELFKAILRFEKQYFPTQQSGFVDPSGAVLSKMETLAARPVPVSASQPPGQWGEFKSGSVQRALYDALRDDPFLSHAKSVGILWSTLSNGTVSKNELDDLEMVATKSRSISARSRAMLKSFVSKSRSKITASGPYELPSDAHVYASKLVCEFLKRVGRGVWPYLDRDEVGIGMLLRVAKPSLLDQNQANLCGPAAALFSLLKDRPGQYVYFATDLYEKGVAKMTNHSIEPRAWVRWYSPPASKIDPVDWLTMASLRDSENWWLSYDSIEDTLSGATTPMEMAWWFTRAGYSDVKEDANLLRHQRDTNNMDEASRLVAAGYRVCLLIDDQMLHVDKQSTSGSAIAMDRHWIVLRSTINRDGGNVKMKVYTWGEDNRQVPKSGVLPLDDFLTNYYGYVAAKP